MAYARDSRGVLVRSDGAGDAWAKLHRTHLDRTYLMVDFDGWHVGEPTGEHAENTEDHLFAEVVPDWRKSQRIRRYGYIALFDRKATQAAVDRAWFTLPVYLHMCRIFTWYQHRPCRFIYVVGGQQPPWHLIELNIHTGASGMPLLLDDQKESWINIWATTGLTGARLAFERQLQTYPSGRP
jgi:hypothetical protein